MRKTVTLLAVMELMLASAAMAAIVVDGINRVGTNGADRLVGTAESDRLAGLGGNDTLIGGEDSDILIGGAGNDLINARAWGGRGGPGQLRPRPGHGADGPHDRGHHRGQLRGEKAGVEAARVPAGGRCEAGVLRGSGLSRGRAA